MKRIIPLLILCLMFFGNTVYAERLTYVDLINRLTDLEYLSVLPVQGEKCAQWSSWERISKYDTATGKYVAWDSNGDERDVIRYEGDQAVFAEMEGPGCIWRIWSATPNEGHVKIYLDGASVPAVDLPFTGYFDCKNAPFIYPSLVHDTATGKNCYVPIPYQKSCKIVADKGWGEYYHFNYSTFPKSTIVPTFKRELSDKETAALKSADEFLSSKLGTDPAGKRKGEVTKIKKISVPACGKVAALKITGAYAITAIKVKVDSAVLQANPDALREVVLSISWDKEKEPSVWAPLIDFFGTAPSANKYKSLPVGVTDDGFYSYWYMPFANEAVVELANDGKVEFPIEISVTYAPLKKNIKSLGRFHAKWHRDMFLPPEGERWIDWTILKTTGRGRFCGVELHIFNPKGGWWGEGDEKFHVDGENFPSTFGTGSEDYFGYAWANPTLFENAYHNQPRSDGNAGHISVNRWHISDSIPFQTSFDGYIEKYFVNARPTLYACTAYWYLAADGVDPYKPLGVNERVGYCVKPPPYKVEGVLEGEDLKIDKITGGATLRQTIYGRWSEDTQLLWHGGGVGDELVFAVPVKEAGKYELKAQITKAADYAAFQLLFDGQKLGDPIDCYSKGLIPSGELSLGTFDLTAGEHQFSAKMTAVCEQSVKHSCFALDYVKLVPVK